MRRSCGVLLPVTSLSSRYGIGCFSTEAYRFIDFLVQAGQSWWQILPLGQTGYGDSPYQSFSTFAGNPYMIDPDQLIGAGYLSREEVDQYDFGGHPAYVDYDRIYQVRFLLLRRAYENSPFALHPKGEGILTPSTGTATTSRPTSPITGSGWTTMPCTAP